MRVNIPKGVLCHTQGKHFLSYEYQLCHATITSAISINDLGVSFNSKLHFQSYADYLLSECIKLSGLIRSITHRFSY
jgi:hypothetical protein